MQHKLTARDFGPDTVNSVLQQLSQEGLQSDRRFTEAYVHQRVDKGYGPVRIRRELQERGVADELVNNILDSMEVDWHGCVRRVREKRFGPRIPDDFREQARQLRFLQYRGYSSDQIRKLFNRDET